MNSSTVRWLFDLQNGGSPRAFECLLTLPGFTGNDYDDPELEVEKHWVCGFVSRTIAGMKMHQTRMHGFRAQSVLFESKSIAENKGRSLERPRRPSSEITEST